MFSMRFECQRACSEVSFGIGFSSQEGIRILSLDSDFYSPRQKTVYPGTGVVSLQLPCLDLQPGAYVIDLGIRSGDDHGLDYLPSAFVVEVIPGPTTPSQIIRAGGGVRVRANWAIDQKII